MAKTELSKPQALAKAQRYTAAAEHCVSQVRLKLCEWGIPSAWQEDIILTLQQDNYLNEARFAVAFAHDKLLYQGWGRYKIRYALIQLHVDTSLIDEALSQLDEQAYREVLRQVAAKKKSATPQEVTRFLLQRGFLYEEIIPLLRGEE